MRRYAIVIVALAGCDLYFGRGQTPDASTVTGAPDAFLFDATTTGPCPLWELCKSGGIYQSQTTLGPDGQCTMPSFTNQSAVATCQYGCSAFAETPFVPAGVSPCGQPPAPTLDCSASGTCSTGATQGCGGAIACGFTANTGSCTCAAGTWSCTGACSDGLCSAEAVQAALVGTWTGTVTPPSFAAPYTVSLTIAPDGSWIGSASTGFVFYYGDNGGALDERILVSAQTSTGAFATVGLFGNEGVQGLLTNVHVGAHSLSFTFIDSWLSCGRDFAFALQR